MIRNVSIDFDNSNNACYIYIVEIQRAIPYPTKKGVFFQRWEIFRECYPSKGQAQVAFANAVEGWDQELEFCVAKMKENHCLGKNIIGLRIKGLVLWQPEEATIENLLEEDR